MKAIAIGTLLMLLGTRSALAHCPLCTIGAGGAALLAAYLGISAAPVGVFVGAFALAIGLWTAKLVKRKFFRGQDLVIGVLSFISVVVPVMPLMDQYASVYIAWMGEYGRTFVLDKFLVGSLIGAVALYVAPQLSRQVARLRGDRMVPFQGIMITLALLTGLSGVLEVSM